MIKLFTYREAVKRMTEKQAESLLQLIDGKTWNPIEGMADTARGLIVLAAKADPAFRAVVESGQW